MRNSNYATHVSSHGHAPHKENYGNNSYDTNNSQLTKNSREITYFKFE